MKTLLCGSAALILLAVSATAQDTKAPNSAERTHSYRKAEAAIAAQ